MNKVKEVVILYRDNEVALFLLSNGQPLLDLAAITRVVLEIDGKTVDSDVVGSDYVWWGDEEEWRAGQNRPTVKFKLGNLDDGGGGLLLEPGVVHGVKLITYDPDNTNGIEWSRSLVVEVLP